MTYYTFEIHTQEDESRVCLLIECPYSSSDFKASLKSHYRLLSAIVKTYRTRYVKINVLLLTLECHIPCKHLKNHLVYGPI